MLNNAMLLRIDDPGKGVVGPALAVRCAVGLPTASESAALVAMNRTAAAVLYLPLGAGVDALAAGQRVRVQADDLAVATWAVVHVAERAGDVLGHLVVFLEPAA